MWEDEIYENKDLRRDAKSVLQEWTQAKGLGLPVYKIIEKLGSDHDPIFKIELNIKKYQSIIGKGKSLQIAQKNTAEAFIEKFIKEEIVAK